MDSEKSIGHELRSLNNLIKREMQRQCCSSDPDYTFAHGWAIVYLFENLGRDVFQKELEQTFNIRGPTVTRTLQLMERNGLIKREAVEHDARLKKIVLTEKAVKLHRKMEENISMLEKKMAKNISAEEMRGFFAVIEKIKSNISIE